jgi:hypothetical protein
MILHRQEQSRGCTEQPLPFVIRIVEQDLIYTNSKTLAMWFLLVHDVKIIPFLVVLRATASKMVRVKPIIVLMILIGVMPTATGGTGANTQLAYGHTKPSYYYCKNHFSG